MAFFESIYYGNTMGQYLIALAIILLSIVGGKIAYWVFANVLKALTKKTTTNLDDIIVESLNNPIVFFIFYLGFNYAYRTLYLTEHVLGIAKNVSFILLAINISWIVLNLVDALIREYFQRIADKTKSDLDNQLLPIIRTIVKILIVVVAIISILDNMGFDIASLLAGLGIGGLAFALAAQDTLKNFFGGMAVFADKPFKVGDRIKFDGNQDGFVREIGVRSTRIETWDGTMVIIPNARIADTVLENVSQERGRRIRFNLSLEYRMTDTQITRAIKIVKDIIKKHKLTEHAEDRIIVTFDKFNDSSIDLLVIYFITDTTKTLKVKHDVNFEIKKQFDKAKIGFAFPTRTLYMKK